MDKRIKDLTGQRFGRLTVLSYVPSDEKGAHWLCQCDCGNQKVVAAKYLLKNSTKSCGCLRKEGINNKAGGRKIEDLSNMKFGLLTPIKATEQRSNGSVVWLCQCDCGNMTLASARNLKLNAKTSCGCAHSVGEINISKLLQEANINYIKEYDVIINNQHRRYDFAILTDNKVTRLIEFDGPQHDGQCFGYFKNLTETIKIHDQEKNQWALENNIDLIRIPYYKRDDITLDDIFSSKYLVK